ncbi:alpha/beta hydrolase [Gracilimonas sp.]|uniref:alpha/beta hydrolase n=1 Tax=Gracilimonas sp. TaxID=1974203 RepID=UPI0032EC266B
MEEIDEKLRYLINTTNNNSTGFDVNSIRLYDDQIKELQIRQSEIPDVIQFEVTIPGFKPSLTLYRPSHIAPPLSTLLYMPGGGFVIDAKNYASPLSLLSKQSGFQICVINYPLAPENKFPTAHDHCIEITKKILDNPSLIGASETKLSIAGDSSGGNIVAIILNELTSDYIEKINSQTLIYPMLDATLSHDSISIYGKGFGFTKEKIEWYFSQYLEKNSNLKDPKVSPFFTPKLRSDMPPTFIASASHDPLIDEALAYGEKFKVKSLPVETKIYPGVIHGFFQMTALLSQSQKLIEDISTFITTHNSK